MFFILTGAISLAEISQVKMDIPHHFQFPLIDPLSGRKETESQNPMRLETSPGANQAIPRIWDNAVFPMVCDKSHRPSRSAHHIEETAAEQPRRVEMMFDSDIKRHCDAKSGDLHLPAKKAILRSSQRRTQ